MPSRSEPTRPSAAAPSRASARAFLRALDDRRSAPGVGALAMLTLLTLSCLLLMPTFPSPAPPEVVLVRSRLSPLAVADPGGRLRALGPMSPRGFGLAQGRLRFLVTSSAVAAVIVEVAGPDGGALFALPIAGGDPIRLTSTRALGLDVALSPDGRRLLYVDGTTPMVLELSTGGSARGPIPILAPEGAPAAPREVRIERPRWLDDLTVAFERAVSAADGRIASVIEVARPDRDPRAAPLIPPAGTRAAKATQDRLAAVVGDSVLAYRDGVLHRFAPGHEPRAIRGRFEAAVVAPYPNVLGRVPWAVLALGDSGVARRISLGRIDPAGVVTPLTEVRTAYLDPLVLPDRRALLWSVRIAGGWVVERVSLEDGAEGSATLTAPHASPIELVTTVPGGGRVVGCRGGEVVVVDATGAGEIRVLTNAPENPSCTVRAVTAEHVAFERRRGDDWRLEILPLDGGPAIPIAGGASPVGVLSGELIVQRGWEGSAAIVHEPSGAPRQVLVPWQAEGITRAKRTPAGRTAIFQVGDDPSWRAVRIDRPGVLVDVTGPGQGYVAIGLTDDRLVAWEAARVRYVSWRLDGTERGAPTVVLEDAPVRAPFAQGAGRVIGGRGDGTVVSAVVDGSERSRPVVVLRGMAPWHASLAWDPVYRRVVASAVVDGLGAIVSASIFGEDAERPRVLGVPRPAVGSDLQRIEVVAGGDVLLEYATSTTAVPHPSGWELLAADGSGVREVERPPARLPASTRALELEAVPLPDDPFGAETRTPLR